MVRVRNGEKDGKGGKGEMVKEGKGEMKRGGVR